MSRWQLLLAAGAAVLFLAVRLLLGPVGSLVAGLVAAAVTTVGVLVAAPRLGPDTPPPGDDGTASGTDRPTPYGVLAGIVEFSGLGPGDVPDLARLTATIGRGLDARTCRLTVHRPGLRDRVSTWTASGAPADVEEVTTPIVQGDEQIGVLAVDRAAVTGERASARRLLDDVVAGLAAVLALGRASIELERQLRAAEAHAEQIAVARRRAVAEMDHERRTIERNLHDGAQHHLVTLGLSLGLVEHQIGAGRLDAARDRLPALLEAVDTAERVIADATAGVATLVLREQGVVAALAADLAGTEPAVAVTTSGIDAARRYPARLEEAVYFCCLESVNNARKHAGDATITVHLAETADALRFTVRDDGPGFVVAPSPRTVGRGLRNLTARAASAGGGLRVDSTPGTGTTVEGFVPLDGHDDRASPPPAAPTPTPPPVVPTVPSPPPEPEPSPGWHDEVAVIARAVLAACSGPAPPELVELVADLDPAADGARPTRERVRTRLLQLEAALPALPIPVEQAIRWREQLERLHVGTRELAEIELLDALRSGTVALPTDVREEALSLLGGTGLDAATRLGLDPDAPPDELRRVAHDRLAHWERVVDRPTATRVTRWAAEVLVRTCEELLGELAT